LQLARPEHLFMERSRSVKKSGCSGSSVGKRSNARADASAAVRKQLINAKRRKNQESDATMLVSFYSHAESLVVVTQTESAYKMSPQHTCTFC
jgi:hypothetical protein